MDYADAFKAYRDIYLDWCRRNITQEKIDDDFYSLTLPFLDRNNDYIVVYIKRKSDNTFYISDLGETLDELTILEGFKLTKRRRDILKSIALSYGITINKSNKLMTECATDDLSLKIHMLAQCILKVNCMAELERKQRNNENN